MRVRLQSWESGFDRLADHVRSMLDEMQGRNYFRSHGPHVWTPRLNLYETARQYVVCVELAGMPREEIEIRVEDGVLHIQGVRRKPDLPTESAGESAHPDITVHMMEIDSGRFHRRVPIAGDVVVNRIAASYRHGYLWIFLPREGAGVDKSNA